MVDEAFFAPPVQVAAPSATTDGASLFSVLHGDCHGTMPVKCASNHTGEELRAKYQRCGKDRCGGPACTETEPVFATGGTGNNMPPEDVFQVWVVVCHKRTKSVTSSFLAVTTFQCACEDEKPTPPNFACTLSASNFACTLSAFE